jgi:hypothetical protein
MATSNSDLKHFAVFVNSKSATLNTTLKSDVTIPFSTNLTYHDPLKAFKFSVVDVLFTNIFYNVRPGYQTLKYLDVFAAGRGFTTPQYRVKTVVIPAGFYSYTSLTTYLNTVMGDTQPITFSQFPFTPQAVYNGFGSNYTTTVSFDVPATNYGLEVAKIWMQTPALGDLYQGFDTTGTVTQPAGEGAYSYIYQGKYLVDDADTHGLLHMLGYSFADVVAPSIPNTPYSGWGYYIYNRSLSGSYTEYSFDNITFGDSNTVVSTANTTQKNVIPYCISDLTGLDDVYIHCPQLRTQYFSGQQKSPLAPNDVIAVIPVTATFGEKMAFIPNFPLSAYLINTNITQLQFVLTNSNNQLLDFNGVDWAMTIFCEEVLDESRLQAENNTGGTFNTPFQIQGEPAAGSRMFERIKRYRANNK